MRLVHIATGGTIEGYAPEYKEIGRLASIFSDVTDIAKYITQSFMVKSDYALEIACKKDSRDITEKDRKKMAAIIKKHYKKGVRNFLITHGTYTMPETGIFLMENIPQVIQEQVNVVITGAMYPLNLIGSDALLNVGASISGLLNSSFPLGIKICMHGKNWDPRNIKKDEVKFSFKEIR